MPDNRIFFLSVPENLRDQIGDDFAINPDIPIPAEIPEGEETLNLEELSWEMIISGMLRVITEGKERYEWIDYYRHFVLAVRPSIMEEFTEAAILKARNGDFAISLEILDALRGLFPSSPVVMLNRAMVMEEKASYLELRDNAQAEEAFRQAEEIYEEALALNPPFPIASHNAGFFFLDRKNYRRARECFAMYAEYGDDEEKTKQAESIIKNIEESGLDDDSFTEAWELIRQGSEEAGLRYIHDFIEKHPSVWNGWFILGWALRRLGRWEDGASAFAKAVELGGANCDTRNELAICLMETGNLKGARHELEAALHDDPENIKIISNLGVLAVKSGRNDEAAAFFRTVLELDPEDAIAKSFIAKNTHTKAPRHEEEDKHLGKDI